MQEIPADGSAVLKIAVCHQFVRYFMEQGGNGQILFFGDYELHGVESDEAMAGQLSGILEKDNLLGLPFAEVRVCWYSDFEIIPSVFFETADLARDTAYCEVMGGAAKFVFSLPAAALQRLQQRFERLQHWHSGAAMVQCLYRQGLNAAGRIFVNIQQDHVEIVCFADDGTLYFYNRYAFREWQDYVYFLLLSADDARLDRNTGAAVMMGELSQDSKIFEATLKYFMQVSFIHAPPSKQFSTAFSAYPKHFNYPLYNL